MTTRNSNHTDDGSMSKYFCMMLHIDDDDLDPYEYRLLGHYRKICGLSPTRSCNEAIETTAARCLMSIATVRKARKSLAAQGCIHIDVKSHTSHAITIVDRMALNIARYGKSDSPIISDSPKVYQKREGRSTKSDRAGLSDLIPIKELEEEYKTNTDVSNDTSPADAGQGDPTSQSYRMVSDHVNDSGEMVAAESVNGGVLVEMHEDTPTSSVPPPPSVRKVNKHGTTVITPRDPIFDSVARLQFGIADTSDMPKGFGARIARIVKVIVDAYKQRNNVTALSPQEREGLAGIHANFWIWYTTVKYPTRGNEPAKELKSDVKFAEYWLEYRAYRNAPKPEPKSTVKDWVWTEEGYKLV